MRHLRADYAAIQPWPTTRPHHAKIDGTTRLDIAGENDFEGTVLEPVIVHDEPVFLLRATDIVAGDTVRAWANYAELRGARSDLVESVRAWADEMDAYREQTGRGHVPDCPAELLPPG